MHRFAFAALAALSLVACTETASQDATPQTAVASAAPDQEACTLAKTPLPPGYTLDRSGAPPEKAKWVGVWTGDDWNNSGLCGTTVIRSVTADTANIVYSYGTSSYARPGFDEGQAKFMKVDGKDALVYRTTWNVEVTYLLDEDVLRGSYYRNGKWDIALRKVQ